MSFGSAMSIAAVLLVLLPPFDLLNSQEAQARNSERLRELDRVRTIVQPPVSVLTKIAEKNPDLEARKDLKNLEEALRRDVPKSPDAIRRETAKTLDRFQDALKKKADAEQFKALRETKKRLRQMAAADPNSQLRKLAENLASGDFAEAQEEINKLKEQLAKRAKSGDADPEQTRKLQKQLEKLSQQLDQAAQDKQSQRELENAGLSETEAQRILENLSKKDPQQIKKMAQELAERLKNSGMTQEQIEEMLQKMKQRQQACSKCNNMAKQMQSAAQQLGQGNLESAMSELGEAGEMLNEMEQLEQGLNDLESQLADLNNSREQMEQQPGDRPDQCQHCNGTGFMPDGSPCPHCQGTGCSGGGSGNGNGRGQGAGRGSGARERNDDVDVDFEKTKANVKTRSQGRIIGKRFIKGQMLKGESAVEIYDAASAAEIDATDAIERGRIPRVYRENVKRYFDRLSEDIESTTKPESAGTGDAKPTPSSPPSDGASKPSGG